MCVSGELDAKTAGSRRLTREDWIAAARKVLVTSGIDDVKVDQLARRMKMTRGSFYWHFQHRKDLLDSLLSDWEGRNYFELAQIRGKWDRSGANLTEVLLTWLGEDPAFPAFDMAIRVWARKSKPVASSVQRIDNAWVELLTELFTKNGFDADESNVRARVAYYHQVGYYALNLSEPLTDRFRMLPHYYRVLTGQEPPADLAEIVERHQAEATRRTTRSRTKIAKAAPGEGVD